MRVRSSYCSAPLCVADGCDDGVEQPGRRQVRVALQQRDQAVFPELVPVPALRRRLADAVGEDHERVATPSEVSPVVHSQGESNKPDHRRRHAQPLHLRRRPRSRTGGKWPQLA